MEPSDLLIRRATRLGREFRFIRDADLQTWALEVNISLRKVMAATLKAGVFPECLERNFPSLSIEEQARLFDASALVAGLGGLGGTLALLLARMGVGRLLLADGDEFTPSNLNRQFLATGRSLGLNKARAAADDLQDINPALVVVPIPHYLTPENLPDYVDEVEIVLDGLDRVSARRDLCAAAQESGVPLVHGAVVGRYGQVTTLLPGDPGGFKRIYPDSALEFEGGREILAPVAALTAGLQALEAVRLLLGQPPAYHGRLAHFDGDTGVLEIVPLGE